MTYEGMKPQCGRSVVQVMVVGVYIEVVTYEILTPQCLRPLIQVLVVSMDIAVVTYEAMTTQCGRSLVQALVGYRSGDLGSYVTPQCWSLVAPGPGYQCGYRSCDL